MADLQLFDMLCMHAVHARNLLGVALSLRGHSCRVPT